MRDGYRIECWLAPAAGGQVECPTLLAPTEFEARGICEMLREQLVQSGDIARIGLRDPQGRVLLVYQTLDLLEVAG